MSKLRVLSLFAGIGGFDLGLERTGGFETVAFCEINEFCRRVLAKNWPRVPCYEDVRTLTGDTLDGVGIGVDVIVGGFPCQDLSTSGTGDGLDGERSGLWHEFKRLIGELRPSYVVLENSPELLDGWLGDILSSLASLGYDAEWECIPASAVGAPHFRDRLWLVAYAHGFGPSGQGGLNLTLRQEAAPFGEAAPLVVSVQRSTVPFVCGRHDGLPPKLGRSALEALGNAVVPQIPELIGRAILQARAAA